MSARTRAAALALVNWKGVFYERYLLDAQVTALEGANGAGKTTVMIAAYVVLLPDMSRLRFTNLGESAGSSSDKGIWGRLGEPNRPSYSALDLLLPDGERLIAGVHLERKAEPSVELTPFVLRHVPGECRLRELLLTDSGDYEQVPVLEELRANAARVHAELTIFSSAKEYFAALFERGVTALRLSSDEDRNKSNEMLRTSMTGGISRALTSELRSFLLKEESGLSDTLSRMRENLDACRQTRTEVAEARRLEHEINAVYEAGQSMFGAALRAAELEHEEALERCEMSRAERERAASALRDAEAALPELETRRNGFETELARLESAVIGARTRIAELERARELAKRKHELEHELESLTETANARAAERESAAEDRLLCRKDLERARSDYDAAARGIADLQRGLGELHRRAHASRTLREKLELLASMLALEAVSVGDLPRLRQEVALELAELDERRAVVGRRLQLMHVWRAERERALLALETIDGQGDIESAYERARAALGRLTELDARSAGNDGLESELGRAERLARAQDEARARAVQLGFELSSDFDPRIVEQAQRDADAKAWSDEQRGRAAQMEAENAVRAAADAAKRLRELELRISEQRAFRERLAALQALHAMPCSTVYELEAMQNALRLERERARAASAELTARRQVAARDLLHLQSGAQALHPDLQTLCDELSAELLAERFEDLEPEEAAEWEARLGPQLHSLLVDDPSAAAREIVGRPRELSSVWLLPADADLSQLTVQLRRASDLIVTEGQSTRVTAVPERPTLGRAARARRIRELVALTASLDVELQSALARQAELDVALLEIEQLLSRKSAWSEADFSLERDAVQLELERALQMEQTARKEALCAFEATRSERARAEALRALLGDAYLLGAPDYRALIGELSARRTLVLDARRELLRVAEARRELTGCIEALRAEITDGERVDELRATQASLDTRRDHGFAADQLLRELANVEHATNFADAEAALAEQGALLPSLEAQLAELGRAVEQAQVRLGAAETEWEQRTLAYQRADAARAAARSQLDRSSAELLGAGISDCTDAALDEARRTSSATERARERARTQQRALEAEIAVQKERAAQKRKLLEDAERRFSEEQQRAEPAGLAWKELCRAADSEGVLASAVGGLGLRGGSSLQSAAEAASRLEVLCDRLSQARALDVAERIRDARASGRTGENYLVAWLCARDWLKRHLPSQVADVADPVEALARLRANLSGLEQRLTGQEADLRGTSSDVARSIEVQVRRARAQVRRINQHLTDISFGNIRAIRVQMMRIERMDRILGAFREGSVQELLFHPNLPIEEALNEIFRRYGGGRSGGQKLLDYREYLELAVEIQRQAGATWEAANPSRLSTGEAIGVGAALMMVILTEWERDAKLLRPKQLGGSLRFLFLDEANRLSQDNLAVLFQLCHQLELQLLIAAPEVAHAERNTTYRLVRVVTDDGREQVRVSGRRRLASSTLSDSDAASVAESPVIS